MRLPNAEHARVDEGKITDYLLSPTHPDGRNKAEFFTRFGFRIHDPQTFREALRRQGTRYPVVRVVESDYGTRYIVAGELETPDGRNPRVRTVWMLDEGSATPRLITAYSG